ncbi:MAG: alpha-1,2-fucosyltransferase [Hyphomicrobiales bacterium]|nr:alpha-1,2-fucosyltransferase [Hyphomicrobiales bacterium]
MLGLHFYGQLGNQMFQYAAARVQAERLGVGLLVEPRQSGEHELFALFPHLRGPVQMAAQRLKALSNSGFENLRRRAFAHNFAARAEPDDNEPFDQRIGAIGDWTWLSGYFQSPRYFQEHANAVRAWFAPPPDLAARVDALLAGLPAPAAQMAAVHIRLGDYLAMRGAHGDPDAGWALDDAYYARALAQFAADAPIALFSDDPENAARMLPRPPAWVSQARSAGEDLFAMAAFPNLVMANSSFSWWAGWLSHNPARIVGPRYHIGWRKQRWFPADIAVDGWLYV